MTGINNFVGSQSLQGKQLALKKQVKEEVATEQQISENNTQLNTPAPNAQTESVLTAYNDYLGLINQLGINNAGGAAAADEPDAGTDEASNVTTTTQTDSLGRTVKKTEVKKDKNGNVVETKITYYQYNGNSTTPTRETESTYAGDENAPLVRIQQTDYYSNGTKVNVEEYDNDGNKTLKSTATYLTNGKSQIIEQRYDNGRIISESQIVSLANGSSQINEVFFDENGNKTSASQVKNFADGTKETIDIKYDTNGNIISQSTKQYYADGTLSHAIERENKYENGSMVSYTIKECYNDEAGKVQVSYVETMDENNVVNKTTTLYSYNQDGKLSQTVEMVTENGVNTKVITTTYEYDQKGRVTKKTTKTEDKINKTTNETVEKFNYNKIFDNRHYDEVLKNQAFEQVKINEEIYGNIRAMVASKQYE